MTPQTMRPGTARSSIAIVAVVALLSACAETACAKKDDAGKPSGVPPLEKGGELAPPAPPPAAAPMPMPVAPPLEAAEAPPPDPGASISGEITVAPAQRSRVQPADTIFLVARRISDNPTARGSLVAVKKLSAASFPIRFTISAHDMPFDNGPFTGELTLTVRADKDGDPMTHLKGDVYGSIPKVRVGARGVKLVLDQLQKEDESLGQPTGAPEPAQPAQDDRSLPPGHPAIPGMPPGHP